MNPEIVISCMVKVFKRCPQGHLSPIGNHLRLTVSYVIGHAPSIIVYDRHHQELLRMVVKTDVTRYTILNPFRHEISRYNDSTIILDFYQDDEDDVRTFTNVMEDVSRKLDRFSSQGEVRDSSSSGSDDEGEHSGAAAAPSAATVRTVQPHSTNTYWDCARCHFASSDEHSLRCDECSLPRVVNWDLEWQCDCPRIHSIMVAECSHCGMWRCYNCTFQNKSTSPHQCFLCRTHRRR